MNRCPKIEYGRLSGEIGWAGVNARKISSVQPKLSAFACKVTCSTTDAEFVLAARPSVHLLNAAYAARRREM